MSIPRPKILSVITIPSGGWAFKIYASKVTQYDTAISVTLVAGDYFLSGDMQSDDLLAQLMTKVQAGITGATITGGMYASVGDGIEFSTSETNQAGYPHRVTLGFYGSGFTGATKRDVKIAWSESDSDLCAALGFGTTDETSTGINYPVFTGSYQHGYAWYSDEDGQLESLNSEDINNVIALQGTSISGKTKSQYVGGNYVNTLSLQFLERYKAPALALSPAADYSTKVFSNGKSYGEASAHPYTRNQPLECWWYQARQGKRFRVYRDGYRNITRRAEQGTHTADNTTTLTDSAKTWSTDPQRWAGRLLYIHKYVECNSAAGAAYIPAAFHVSSNTATVLTVTAHPCGTNVGGPYETNYYLFDHTYQTYVVDLDKMKSFDPKEIPVIDRYNIDIPLKRYVA